MDLKSNRDYQRYISDICAQIKSREVQKEVSLELEHHIQDIYEEYLEEGLEEREAIKRAIERMGNAEAVGRGLNKVHNPRPDWGVLGLTFLLAVAGLAAAYFLDADTGLTNGPESMFLDRVILTILGFALAAGLYFLDYRKLQQFSLYIYLGVLLGLVFISMQRGVYLYNIRINTNFVEVSPLLLAVSLAGLFPNWKWNQPKYLTLALGMLFVPLILIIIYPSSSAAALVYAAVFIALMYVSRARFWHILLPLGFAAVGIPLLTFINSPYSLYRWLAFFNPSSDPSGHGWLPLQLENLRNSAGIFGQGLSTEPWLLPAVHGEFILSYIIYTFGWLVGIALITAAAAFVIRMAGIGMKVKDLYGKLLITGITTILAVRFLWHILMNLGVLPLAGISLPFISYGRIDFLMSMIMIGLTLSVFRRKSLGGLKSDTVVKG